jgi:hypothetical protein
MLAHMKRGTIKAFREYLNAQAEGHDYSHRNGPYHQVSRKYGDYLYHQDRDKFMWELNDALQGKQHPNFKY